MKQLGLGISLVLVVSAMVATLLAINVNGRAIAAKPSKPDHNVVAMSNGYPSGAHFNLNVHGKKYGFNCPEPDPLTGYGSSLFIPEYQTDYPSPPNDPTIIEFIASKKRDVDKLTVIDACSAQFDNLDDKNARVQLPKTGIYSEGFWVFARVRAKPQNGKVDGEESDIILTPNPVIRVCNDGEADLDGDGIADDCPSPDSDLLALGLVTNNGVYKMTSTGLERFDSSSPTKGKGKATATDITGLFTWTGYVCPSGLDVSGPDGVPDGSIDVWDVPNDLDGDGDIDDDDLAIFLAALCEFHNSEWVFNVADLVVEDLKIVNDGVKLLKIRFYPVATTEFTPSEPHLVTEIHDDSDETVVTGGVVAVGTSVHDSATISAGTGPTPEGTVDFTFYTNGTCAGAGVPAGSGIPLVSGVAHPSVTQGPLTAGVYSFNAHYNGDDPNGFYVETDSPCEPLAVGEIPTVTIEIHDMFHVVTTTVLVGETVHPQATVAGGGPMPTGTVTFLWFINGGCTPLAADSSVPGVALDGAGVADGVGFAQTPATDGLYSFRALYNGDDAYLPVLSDCETLTVLP